MPTLGQLGEFALIERLISQFENRSDLMRLGMGDDCAIIPVVGGYQLLSTDSLVSGVHFDLNLFPAEAIGYRALAVNISDVAAMGGVPKYALVSIHAPSETEATLLEEVYSGLNRCAEKFQVKIVGGNVTSAAELIIAITIVGEVDGEPIRRSGAGVGDGVWISGAVGGAAAGLRLFRKPSFEGCGKISREEFTDRLFFPEPRVELGRLLQTGKLASAMIDVSDGVIQDLGHLARASNVSAELDLAAVPRQSGLTLLPFDIDTLISAGDDYELLFTVPKAQESALLPIQYQLTRIGEIVPKGRGNLSDLSEKLPGSFQHFS